MIIYNVTVHVEEAIQEAWITWMQQEHIPDMLATGKFTAARLVRVMVEEEAGGMTYSVQYQSRDYDTLQAYYSEDAQRMRNEAVKRFADKFIAFRTELEVISEHGNEG